MRSLLKYFITVFVIIYSYSNINAATYYVSTTGSDGNTGTIASPWATWQYGFNRLVPGDILYIRGGTYTPTVITTIQSRNCAVVVSAKNGTASNKYQVFAYPGETPVLDCRNITGSNERIGIFILNSSFNHNALLLQLFSLTSLCFYSM